MISIIVPIYNVEKYIFRCIQSIINQTYIDWELLLIDDGSQDDSGKICDKLALTDNRIKVFHKKNGGVSSARNKGLDLATGNYICFIDSDDWIDKSYLDDFKIDIEEADLYISGALYDINNQVYSYKKYSERKCIGIENIKNEYFAQSLFSNGYPWGKLFRKSIIDKYHLRFNEDLPIHEDHLFVFQYLPFIKDVFIINTAGYHYTVLDNTGRKLSGRLNTYSHLRMASDLFKEIIGKIKQIWSLEDKEYSDLINNYVYSTRLNALRSLVLKGEKQYLSDEINYWKDLKYKGINRKDAIVLNIVRNHFPFKFYVLVLFYSIIGIMHHDRLKMIYKDLQTRSIVVDSLH